MTRSLRYRRLENPFEPQRVFSADQIAALHDGALSILEGQGMKVLLPRARQVYAKGGALVDEASTMVRIDRGLVAQCLASAPRSITLHSVNPAHHAPLSGRAVVLAPSSGAPNIMDIERGRRAGTLADFCDGVKLCQSLDIIHALGSMCEPQDIPPPLRHLEVIRAQLTLSDKIPFTFSRGIGQVADCFEALRIVHGIGVDEFRSRPCTYTIINTNSPLQLDLPMADGIIDFATAGQVLMITPFTLAGAMAPVTIAGALTLHIADLHTVEAPRCAGRVRQLYLECRHEVRLACFRYAGVRQGAIRRRTDGAAPGVAVALLECNGIECAGRAGRI